MKRILLLIMMIGFLFIIAACSNNDDSNEFDATPYLGEAFQRLTNHEQVRIGPKSAKWIYTETSDSELAVLHLFVNFTRQSEGDYYAMMTIYVNHLEETLVDVFIDRVYNDELQLTISSAQSYQNMYQSMLSQVEAYANSVVQTGDITDTMIENAMRGVTTP